MILLDFKEFVVCSSLLVGIDVPTILEVLKRTEQSYLLLVGYCDQKHENNHIICIYTYTLQYYNKFTDSLGIVNTAPSNSFVSLI